MPTRHDHPSTHLPAPAGPDRRRFQALLGAGLGLGWLGRAGVLASGVAGAGSGGRALAAGPDAASGAGGALPVFDAHIHYSHDAWELVPPPQAIAILRQAGLRGAFVSSSNDQGTQMLVEAARAAGVPGLIVPELRPYRLRSDVGSWVRDEAITRYMEERLARHRYVGVGEFHLYGEDAELAVPRRMVALAREHGLILHAHSDADAVARLFRQWPDARVLWAHAGFEPAEKVREQLRRWPRLWCDLAFRSDQGSAGHVDPAWRAAFEEFPGRFMVGTDTYTPERWHYIAAHATYSRGWLADLPRPLAEAVAWRNAEALLRGAPGA
ncbi:MAG: hypothetical protein RLZZ584_2698 [Pseudomonadota bacterium]